MKNCYTKPARNSAAITATSPTQTHATLTTITETMKMTTNYTTALEALATAWIQADNGAKHTEQGVIITRSAHMAMKEKLAYAVDAGMKERMK